MNETKFINICKTDIIDFIDEVIDDVDVDKVPFDNIIYCIIRGEALDAAMHVADKKWNDISDQEKEQIRHYFFHFLLDLNHLNFYIDRSLLEVRTKTPKSKLKEIERWVWLHSKEREEFGLLRFIDNSINFIKELFK